MVRQLARFINMVQAEEALRQAAAELWPSGHKQIHPGTIFIPRCYIYSALWESLCAKWRCGHKPIPLDYIDCLRLLLLQNV